MDTLHPEGGSVEDDASIAAVLSLEGEQDVLYTQCPVETCGEQVLWSEFDTHLELHAVEQDSGGDSGHASEKLNLGTKANSSFDTKLSHALRNINSVDDDDDTSTRGSLKSDKQDSAKAWKDILNMPDTSPKQISSSGSGSRKTSRRLGVSEAFLGNIHHVILRGFKKSQLGPHADEKQMPEWLITLLQKDGETKLVNRLGDNGKLKKVKVCTNHTSGIIPVLEQLLQQDRTVEYAYLCHPAVKHVSKLDKEGYLSHILDPRLVSYLFRRLLWLSKHPNVKLLHYRS
jgi:hypothetical protein